MSQDAAVKGPIKDKIAELLTLENIVKLITLLMSLKKQQKTQTETAPQTVFMGDDPAVSAVADAMAGVPEEEQAACLEECVKELCDEGRIKLA